MVKAFLGIFLLLCGLVAPAQALPPFETGTSTVAQDGAGTVWALTSDYGRYGALRRWQTGAGTAKTGDWVIETIPGADRFQPRALTRGGDGSVYALWQTVNQEPPQCLVTVQRGVASRTLVRFTGVVIQEPGFSSVPAIFAGSKGDVWLSGNQPLLRHISPDGILATFPLKPEQYFGGKMPDSYSSRPLDSLVDGEGRRWFWQSSNRSNWQPDGLRGVLIWDGKTLAYQPTLQGIPDRNFSVLAPLETNHLWLAAVDSGYENGLMTHGALYRVDTRTLSAAPETPPGRGALQNIVQIFQVGGDWYVVEQGQNGQPAALWRKQAGRWRQCLDKLEEIGGYYSPDLRHPWLAEPSGVWLGVSGGAWWVPRSGKPAIWVNWRRGLPALNVSGLFPLRDGRILAVGTQGEEEGQMAATPQPLRPLPSGVVTGGRGAPKYLGPLHSDPRQHLWGTRTSYSGPCPLDEWDGKHWQTHLVPKSIPGAGGLYACDTLGRIWLTTSNWNPPAQPQPVEGRAVYDPARDTWINYTTVQDALQAAAAFSGMAFLPHRNTDQPPLFSGDGRVTYAYNTTVFLFDGQSWRHWEAHEILPNYPYGNLGGGPHFNAKGHLEVALANGSPKNPLWVWTAEAGWQQAGEQETANNENPVPPGGPRGLAWATPVVDSHGGKWFLWHDMVYTARQGLWVKQSELSGPGSPFRYGYGIEDVLTDPAGRLFFVARPAGYYDFVVWSPPPVPKPLFSVTPLSDDSVTGQIQTKLTGLHWFRWRLNESEWHAPQTANTVTLTALPHGDYRIEVQALDRRLQASATAVAVFSIRVAPGAQIARWVRALLSGTEAAREAAVAGLIKQPAAALPALRAARPGASDSGRWWLDAAIQQITPAD